MNSNICSHPTKVTADTRTNCAFCNAFISSSDGKVAIKDPALGGLHQIFPQTIFSRLLAERAVLPLNDMIYSAYARARPCLVDWLNIMKEKLGISEGTLHVAVRYMDYILAQKDYHQSKYQLIALSCLVIAAKYDELDRNIPFPEDFTRLAKLPFRSYVLTECEMLLLKILDWQLKVSTTYGIAHCLLSQGVLFSDDLICGTEGKKRHPKEEHAALLTKIVKFFVNSAIRSMDQGKLGIALVLCGRKALGVMNVWNPRLAELTLHSWEEIKASYEFVLREYGDEIKYCTENAWEFLEVPAVKGLDLKVFNETTEKEKELQIKKVAEKENKERPHRWIIMNPGTKENFVESPQSKFEELRMWKPRALGQFKEPLGLSQRLNISG